MKTNYPEEIIYKIADSALNTRSGMLICQAVTVHFKSMHYVSSALIAKCVALNLALNDEITPTSADRLITCMRRRTRSLYTTVEQVFFPVSDRFDKYAKEVLGDSYEKIRSLNMRTANYIVYVISLDLKKRGNIIPAEIIKNSLSYRDLLDNGFINY